MTTVAAWTTAQLPARDLRAGDRIDLSAGLGLRVEWVEPEYDITNIGTFGRAFQVPRDRLVTVHVPDEPVDGYGLWRPKPGTWSYSGCTCVARLNPEAGYWRAILRDCAACVAESDPYRDND